MRRNMVVALAIVAMSVIALYGQSVLAAKMDMPARHGMYMTGVYDKLGLTPDQRAKLEAIRKDARSGKEAVLADKSLTREARRARLHEIRTSERAKMDEVLTPAQRQQFKDLLKAKMEAKGKRFAEALGLTADQQARIKAIHQDAWTEIKAVKADTSLTPEQRTARIKEIGAATHEKVLALLTPEQRAKFAERKGGQRHGFKCPVM
jgi:Spy/CpxP family protein refolding chaperone